MRVLIVTTSPVLPPTYGGRVRTHGLACALAKAGAEVDVVAPWAPGGPRRSVEGGGARFHPHFLPANALALLFRDRLVPSMVAHSWQPFPLGPAQLMRRFGDYDVVQFEHVGRARWMRAVSARLKVYSAHNVEYDFLRVQPGRQALRAAMLRSVASLERRAVQDSHLVVTCTQADATRLAGLYGPLPDAAVIPNGFDAALQTRSGPSEAQARAYLGIPPTARVLLFVGSAGRLNLQATRFLVEDMLPKLPLGFHLLLVGESGPATPISPAMLDRVHSPGRLSDLRTAFAAADIAVNPVMSGSGSNVKLADYLASQLPIVTTPVGLRGFEQHVANVVVANPSEFADAVLRVGNGPRRSSGVETLSWSRLGRKLFDVYAKHLGGADRVATITRT